MSEQVARVASSDLSVRRANGFLALARAYNPPGDWPDDLAEIFESAFMSMGGAIRERSIELITLLNQDGATPEELAPVHARLFIGPFDIQAPPWASLYLDPEKQLMGETSRYVAEAYAEAGLGPVSGPTDAPDHVTHELEFMYFLAFREHESGDAEWYQRQTRFWREHLGIWLPQLADLIKQAGKEAPFYQALSELTLEFSRWLENEGFDLS
jgi:TorA maturation chaperone TorD